MTFNAALTLGGSQTWNVGPGRTLTVGSTVTANGITFTQAGSGAVSIATLKQANNVTTTRNINGSVSVTTYYGAAKTADYSSPAVTIRARSLPVGTYPLVTWTGTQSGAVPSSATLPPRIIGNLALSGDGKTLNLVVTGNTQPLTWATGSGEWDIGTSTNWRDNAGTVTAYAEGTLWGDAVVFEDSRSGASPDHGRSQHKRHSRKRDGGQHSEGLHDFRSGIHQRKWRTDQDGLRHADA